MGNIQKLKRTANGNLVDNLIYSYNGNQLNRLTKSVSGIPLGDIFERVNTTDGTFSYDENGNMIRKKIMYKYDDLIIRSSYNYIIGRITKDKTLFSLLVDLENYVLNANTNKNILTIRFVSKENKIYSSDEIEYLISVLKKFIDVIYLNH